MGEVLVGCSYGGVCGAFSGEHALVDEMVGLESSLGGGEPIGPRDGVCAEVGGR